MKKLNTHLELSEEASNEYDAYVGRTCYSVVAFEKYFVDEMLSLYTPQQDKAVDLGCGTGRISFLLAQHFNAVSAYDISPSMLEIATEKSITNAVDNISFRKKNLETEDIGSEGNIDALFASFGFGSFIKDISNLLLKIYLALRVNGVAYVSFYNKKPQASREGSDVGSTLGKRSLGVTLKNKSFEIPIYPHSTHELKQILSKFRGFEILILTVLNRTYLKSIGAPYAEKYQDSEKYIALVIQKNRTAVSTLSVIRARNPFNSTSNNVNTLASVSKQEDKPTKPLGKAHLKEKPMSKIPDQLQAILDANELTGSIKRHKPVMTMKDVEEIFTGVSLSCMLKAILVKYKKDGSAHHCVCGIPANTKLDMRKLAILLQVSKNRFKFAQAAAVQEITGYPVGAISPLGLPEGLPVVIDSSFRGLSEIWCGVGVNDASLKVSTRSLFKLTSAREADISTRNQASAAK